MRLLTRQEKGSKLTIEEMDNNLLYLQSLSGTNFTEAKIGSDTDYSLFDEDGSLRFFGGATTYNDHPVDILTESGVVPLVAKVFRNNGSTSINYGTFTSGLTYGTFNLSGYTELNDAIINGYFSISIWFKMPMSSTGSIFSIVSENDNNIIIFSIKTYGARVSIKTEAGSFYSSNYSNIYNTWQHICYVQSGTTCTLYFNNIPTINTSIIVPITSLPSSGFFTVENVVNSELIVPFKYELTNLRLYNVSLSLDQVIELYNYGTGLNVNSHPSGIVEETDVIFNFKNFETSGLTLYNSAPLGIGKNITFSSEPFYVSGCSCQVSTGVYLPVFPNPLRGTVGSQRSIRFEMSHDWKISSPISLHMHVSSNIPILSGQTIVFLLERTIQDIYGVLTENSLHIINSAKTFNTTSVITYTFTTNYNIPAYANFILVFNDIDMSNYTSVSTCGAMTLTRRTGTFTGDIFEIQAIRMHYQIDGTGSRQEWVK